MLQADQSIDAVDLLKSLISIPSLSHEEALAADFVQKTVEAVGLTCTRHDDNVWFGIEAVGYESEGDEDVLLLNSHLDVVPPSADHPYDPFDPVEVDGRLFGRGSVDAKASGAAMTVALLRLVRNGWKPHRGKVVVALTTCEEAGGGYNGLETIRPLLPSVSAAIIGEPTGLQPCVAQKGLLILNVTAEGKSAHAARPGEGANALYAAAGDLLRIEKMEFDRVHEYLGSTTATATMIEGGTARNVIPDRCTFTLDVRSTPSYRHDELIRLIESRLVSEVSVHSKRLHPVDTRSDARIVNAASDAIQDCLGLKSQPFGSPTMSDWIFLKDVECVKLGPGDSRLSHTGAEAIEVEEVRAAVEVYKNIVTKYFES